MPQTQNGYKYADLESNVYELADITQSNAQKLEEEHYGNITTLNLENYFTGKVTVKTIGNSCFFQGSVTPSADGKNHMFTLPENLMPSSNRFNNGWLCLGVILSNKGMINTLNIEQSTRKCLIGTTWGNKFRTQRGEEITLNSLHYIK